jgi:hypothetical protein
MNQALYAHMNNKRKMKKKKKNLTDPFQEGCSQLFWRGKKKEVASGHTWSLISPWPEASAWRPWCLITALELTHG